MEYRYAAENDKPIIAFLHKDPESIPSGKTETESKPRKLLEDFRNLAQARMCKYWTSPQELGSVVSRSLIKLQRQHPGVGWVRSDSITDKDSAAEILRLRRTIDSLNKSIEEIKTQAPKGTENLEQGDDVFEIMCDIEFYNNSTYHRRSSYKRIPCTWNEIFYTVSPSLIDEATETKFLSNLKGIAIENGVDIIDENMKDEEKFKSLKISDEDLGTIIVQLRALGLIQKSDRTRSVKDRSTYWSLTPYGDVVMNRLRAIRKQPAVPPPPPIPSPGFHDHAS